MSDKWLINKATTKKKKLFSLQKFFNISYFFVEISVLLK